MMNKAQNSKSALTTDLKSVLTFRLAQLQNKLNASAIRVLKIHSDLSLSEWRILSMVFVWEGSTMSKLVRESGIDKGQVSRNLKKLIEREYVSTTSNDADGRQQHLYTSAKGKTIYLDLLPTIRQRQYQLTQGVNVEDLAIFDKVLDQLSVNVKTMTDAGSVTDCLEHNQVSP